ncbi:MAG: T9SS type A sorting domain-containing protein [Lewinellaceae bacterium]|nr:T9SS type A sorting domain-containing protein [Lewinellaceae bacterium]
MRIASVLFFTFLTPFAAFCQAGFNIAADLGLVNNNFKDLIVHNDTIVGLGLARADTIDWQQGLLVAMFDSSGNLLAYNVIVDSLGDYYSIDRSWGKIAKVSDGGYALTSAPLVRDGAVLVKLNRELEVEFVREYPDTVNISHFNYKAPIEISDGYLLYGSIQRPSYKEDPFIRRVDKQGNTLWLKYFGDYNLTDVFNDAHLRDDSTIVLSGGKSLDAQTGISIITIVNLEGDVVDSWESVPNPEIGFLRKTLLLDDGGYLTYGLYPADYIFSTLIVQPTVARLDSNFQVLWVLHFGPIKSINALIELRDIEPTADGNFIGAGEITVKEGDAPSRRVGWLFKFTPQGDSLWSRYIDPPFFPLGQNTSGWFGGVGELSSGSLVAGGFANQGIYFYPWLVKTDANGCIEAPCEPVNAAAGPALSDTEPLLFPNPASGRFYLSWPGRPPGEARCTLLDAQGRVAWRGLRHTEALMEFEAGGLPAGLYFLEVVADGRRWTGKVSVQ